jgi:hypothetical protein
MIPAEHEIFIPVYIALGKALSQWAIVEHAVGRCHTHCRPNDPDAAMDTYWKLRGYKERRTQIGKLIHAGLVGDAFLRKECDRLHGKLVLLANQRHAMAHGSVGVWHGRPGIAPFFFEKSRGHIPSYVLRVEDIDETKDAYIEMVDDLTAFLQALRGQ